MAPISLVLLNPLGFLCMELGERRKESRRVSQQSSIYQSDPSLAVESASPADIASRKVSSVSTASLSSVNHKRTNGCKV